MQVKLDTKKFEPKIKTSNLMDTYNYGGLKNVDIFHKVVSLQLSVCQANYDEWKVVPLLHLIKRFLIKNFEFHSNLDISAFLSKNLYTLEHKSCYSCYCSLYIVKPLKNGNPWSKGSCASYAGVRLEQFSLFLYVLRQAERSLTL